MSVKSHEFWMHQALILAAEAASNNEVPVGAVVVLAGEIIGRGRNAPIHKNDPTAHAEIQALQHAAAHVANYRLIDADIYVTLEPCTMCAGALVHSRIRNLYFGALEPKSGAVLSNLQILDQLSMNHKVSVCSGVLADQCGLQLSEFFARRRKEKKLRKHLDR